MAATTDQVVGVALGMAIDNDAKIMALLVELNNMGIKVDMDAVKQRADEISRNMREKIENELNK